MMLDLDAAEPVDVITEPFERMIALPAQLTCLAALYLQHGIQNIDLRGPGSLGISLLRQGFDFALKAFDVPAENLDDPPIRGGIGEGIGGGLDRGTYGGINGLIGFDRLHVLGQILDRNPDPGHTIVARLPLPSLTPDKVARAVTPDTEGLGQLRVGQPLHVGHDGGHQWGYQWGHL